MTFASCAEHECLSGLNVQDGHLPISGFAAFPLEHRWFVSHQPQDSVRTQCMQSGEKYSLVTIKVCADAYSCGLTGDVKTSVALRAVISVVVWLTLTLGIDAFAEAGARRVTGAGQRDGRR